MKYGNNGKRETRVLVGKINLPLELAIWKFCEYTVYISMGGGKLPGSRTKIKGSWGMGGIFYL